MKDFRDLSFEDHASLYASYNLQEAVTRAHLLRLQHDYEDETSSSSKPVFWRLARIVIIVALAVFMAFFK